MEVNSWGGGWGELWDVRGEVLTLMRSKVGSSFIWSNLIFK